MLIPPGSEHSERPGIAEKAFAQARLAMADMSEEDARAHMASESVRAGVMRQADDMIEQQWGVEQVRSRPGVPCLRSRSNVKHG